ncbi:uncharacterized protein LOC110024042 [Phalaenopsis equestris]|uniref:uncharacterized protein LOC110024042 n=1 Tax=Phalaenopsis equestris TaxID=78828 RepID=UPI0009E48F3A|nr:uncharacterized protein LOC110024042 [Phalaenopsis equestris]
MLWWRRRQGDVEKGMRTISTFDDFKKKLKRQFYPENAEDEARAQLRRLKQIGSIREYIKEFTSLVLQIPDLLDKDALFNLIDMLQQWAKTELRRRGAQDLAFAIAIAESLVDYTKESTKPNEKKSNYVRSGGNWEQHKEENLRESTSFKARDKGKFNNNKTKPYNSCFLCGGPHWVRDCPQKKALNSLLASYQEVEENDIDAQVGTMQLLNAVRSSQKNLVKGLLFVEVIIRNTSTNAMMI